MVARTDPADEGGPTVGLCAGMRCAALWRRRGDESTSDVFRAEGPERIRNLIRTTKGGVLVRLPCMGSCSQGPVVGVAYRPAHSATPEGATWIACADAPRTYSALVEWVAADWSRGPVTAPPSLRRRP
ncbi:MULTISPECIES: hypothetical protein [unclassified Rhodococcus (in: high G+C Gram-positive bacteria)]|uniref:hypothetical protein n=1 Tax=unclassified Rhodococcus (in: high G+C Gram-positive bacteria) TaxID=192944 RepID=UPI00163AF91D|nr:MULTISPECIES: hypothetical protein [unclassified Rhodococcus (in: high G+C Gram-positive bacteria)]MBC2644357.1 hypothetical protein [Rhodococcus sp. 3A]MBC2897951.1 hypothetical protein [Rhodococcus sp. 4CII]